jgi:uncharacterized protein YecE (DUF72 family)
MVATPASVTGAYVGTSGFSYPSWRGEFYPEQSKPTQFLELYSGELPSVELNTTFYQLPSEDQMRRWADQTPPAFRFSVKVNRRITHGGRLELLPTFLEQARALGDRLGPFLVQFPETRTRDDGFLQLLLGSLDPELEYAFEFRHESWVGVERVQVINELGGDAPFRYLRLREPPYTEAQLREWADRLAPLLAAGKQLFVYFKHEDEPLAPRYARRLLDLLSERAD